MDFTVNKGPEKVLEKTLQDLQIRAEVETTMQSMLVDVEVAFSLQQEVHAQSQLSELRQQVSHYEVALQEAQAVQSNQRQEQGTLADSLVEQLWTLSQELGQLRRWKETHETTITDHDEVLAKLMQAEEQIRVLESRPPAAAMDDGETGFAFDQSFAKDLVPSTTIAMIPEASVTKDAPTTIETVTKPPSKPTTATIPEQNDVKENEAAAKEAEFIEKEVDALLAVDGPTESILQSEGIQPDPVGPDNSAGVPGAASLEDNAPAAAVAKVDDNAVVALLEEEVDDIPTLDTLNTKALNRIFEFLDAVEILNTAQINITMFSRVDALFGLSGGEAEEPATAAGVQQPAEPSVPPAVITTTTTTVSSQPPAPQVPSRAPLALPTTGPADAKMPAQPLSNTTAPAIAPRRGGIFSLLQARGNGIPVARKSAAGTPDQPLSAAMTDSMVSKLNDKELSAIFSLTEKLHQREKAVATLTKEKEELAGKLKGMEDLKTFFIKKVRNVEQSLRKSQEDEMKVTQQISSDQEVIAFLDGRVQELERDLKSLSDEKETIAEEMSRLQTQNDKKIEVLGDMLQFERERVSENEREWKATKKLLVKEIKSCRAQLLALQAERDGFREQNERLKKAVLMTNPSSGSM